jgi:CMP-N-acetylneuraminic acid synthetase
MSETASWQPETQQLLDNDNVYIFEKNRSTISKDILKDGLFHPTNSGMLAMNLALIMNAKRIYLLGFDYKYRGNQMHFFPNYPHHDTYKEEKFIKKLDKMIHFLPYENKFINLNPNSNLNLFKKMRMARKDSKGFPGKNRKLLNYTLQTIPEKLLSSVIITSNDDWILENTPKKCIKIKRSEKLSNDTASTKSVMSDVVKKCGLNKEDIICMLYLTYPTRQFDEVINALQTMVLRCSDSLLCKKETKTHPFLCIYEDGKQVIKHDLYRRQDYPVIYEISHYICVFRVSELKKLNSNLYNKNTYFHKISDCIDVDHEKDYYNI